MIEVEIQIGPLSNSTVRDKGLGGKGFAAVASAGSRKGL